MSELEKARAGFVLSLLVFAAGLVLLQHERPAPVPTTEQTITVCAATKGALCTPSDAIGGIGDARETRVAGGEARLLGTLTVTAQHLPMYLGDMLVLAPRFATELDGRLRLASARGPAEGEIILAQ